MRRIRLSTGHYIVLMVLFLAVWLFVDRALDKNCRLYSEQARAIAADNRGLKQEYNELKDELEFVRSEEGIRLYAYSYGYQKEGEVRYNAVSGN